MIQKPRGTIDILPEEIPIWRFIENTARDVADLYGFKEIRFPTFEATELFTRGVGDTTDVVQKEMYTFTDRENRSLTLRPEGTASVARSLVENGRCSDTMPIKLYYLINCFRYEKPQAGRSREFYQFGCEMYGAQNAASDATIISFADTLIKRLGIKGAKLHVNSIGCPECRKEYKKALVTYYKSHEGELCETCKTRLETNPLRLLDCKVDNCKKLADSAPRTVDYLCGDCKAHFETLTATLGAMEIEYTIDPKIVRGLDYYTRTVFEFICPVIGAQSTILGGGRYDGLTKDIGGPALPGIGFACGITRLILAMKESGVDIKDENRQLLYIAPMGDSASLLAAKIVTQLRCANIGAETDLVSRSLKAQMKYANKIGAKYTLIIGDNEMNSGTAQLKNMDEGSQEEISLSDIIKIMTEKAGN